MIEALPLYTIALCAVAIAIGTFVNFVLLVSVRRGLERRDRARGEFHRNVGGRIDRIERYLVSKARAAVGETMTTDFKFKIPDSRTRREDRRK